MATAATATKANTNRESRAATADVQADIERIRADVASLTRSISQLGKGQVDKMKSQASSVSDDVVSASQQALHDLQDQLDALSRSVESQVRRHPLQSLGIAVGIGFLLALFTRR